MKAIMLVAGEGTRMYPLTHIRPKPLLKILNKPILQHNLEQLSANGIDEVALVVGQHAERIRSFLGNSFNEMKIQYFPQKERLGTAHALLQAKDFINNENFIAIYGDDAYHRDDIRQVLKNDLAVTAKEVVDPERFGVFVVENNFVKDLVEKPKSPVSNLANTGLQVFDTSIFKIIESLKQSSRGELELTDAIKILAAEQSLRCEITNKWIPIGYPWDLLTVTENLMKEIKREIDKTALIEEHTTLIGEVKVGKNTRIKNGVYIEGPVIIGDNCIIGPNCYIRSGTVIGNNCKIGNAVEIKNSIIGDNTKVEHLSYVGDSIIGNFCNLGAGTITANLRHDGKTLRVMVKGELIDTKRRKFGVIMADYSKTGTHNSIYPGTMMGPFSWSVPSIAVSENIDPFHIFDGTKKPVEKSKFEPLIKNEEDVKYMNMLYEKLKK